MCLQSQPQVLVAELVIDATVFQIGSVSVRHYELEVESRATDGGHALSRISESLTNRWPQLRRWPHSKIAVGKALEEVLSQDKLPTGGRDSKLLGPADYDLIVERLGEPSAE